MPLISLSFLDVYGTATGPEAGLFHRLVGFFRELFFAGFSSQAFFRRLYVGFFRGLFFAGFFRGSFSRAF
jgi:hypothetical protein